MVHQHHHSLQSTGSNHPVHWDYSSPTATSLSIPLTSTPVIGSNLASNNNNTWTPPTTRGVKRAMSESDCDDIYSEESSKEQWVSSDELNDVHALINFVLLLLADLQTRTTVASWWVERNVAVSSKRNDETESTHHFPNSRDWCHQLLKNKAQLN